MKNLITILAQVKMPITRMDLGGMESMQATVSMDPWLDKAIAIAAPLLLVLITLPATIVRAALLGLDCVVLRCPFSIFFIHKPSLNPNPP